VGPVGFRRIRAERIEFVTGGERLDEPGPAPTRAEASDHHRTGDHRSPLALDAKEGRLEPEDEVVAASFRHRPIDLQTVLQSALRDRELRNSTLLARRQLDPATVAARSSSRYWLFRPWPLRASRAGRRPTGPRGRRTRAPRA
jgi:hypothetical protein